MKVQGDPQSQARLQAWADALDRDTLPAFVTDRLRAAEARKLPWLSTMTPAELLLGRSHGVRPLATVSGTCWVRFGTGSATGYMTDEWGSFAAGWSKAIARMKREALAAGANAVVDVQMRSTPSPETASADFTVFGTAIRFDRLPASRDPLMATVPAIDFVRLLDRGIVVCGMGIGTAFDFIRTPGSYTNMRPNGPARMSRIAAQMSAWGNQPVEELGDFWQDIRRRAHQQLRQNTQAIGRGVLAHTNLSQLVRTESGADGNYFGRHIVIGTIVDTGRARRAEQDARIVLDMAKGPSPLNEVKVTQTEAVLKAGLERAGRK